MVGDLKMGRTIHSLAKLLTLHGAAINYVSPPQLGMPRAIIESLDGKVTQHETTDLGEVIEETDVLYVTRIQKERHDARESELHQENYVINATVIEQMPKDSIVMHPLPRVSELHPEIDSDPRAAYFRQVKNGMYMRMGLLTLVNGRSIT
jgi:carbamoyl-phosphate synthase/aspartate carbamoyltransferase/dihydroorotase